SPPAIIQGDQGVAMVWVKMRTDVSEATWKALLVERMPVYQTAQQQAGGGSNTDVSFIKIYRDANLDGVLQVGDDPLISSGTDQFPANIVGNSKQIFLTEPQQIGALSWKSYLLVYDVSPTALRDNTLGMKLASNAYFTLDLSNNRNDTVEQLVVYDKQTGLAKPGVTTFATDPANIGPIKVSAIGLFSAAMPPPGLTQDSQYPLMALDMKVHTHSVGWSGLLIEQTGIIQSDAVPPLKGDGALAQIGLYKDNISSGATVGDGVYGSGDMFISSVTNGAVDFNSGVARLYFSTQTITTTPARYFIIAKIGRTDAESSSTEGQTVGIKILNYSYFTINPYTAIVSTESAFPYNSPLSVIRHYSKATTPVVYVDEWIASQNEVKAAWLPGESPDPAQFPILYNEYGVSTKPIILDEDIPDFTDWQQVGLSTYIVSSMPLPLADEATYYVAVRSVNNVSATRPDGIASLPGSAKFRVDLTPPTVPGKPEPSTYLSGVAATQYTVKWGFSADLQSGVLAYEVQEREDSNPVWNWVDVNVDGAKSSPKDSHTLSGDLVKGGVATLTVLGKTEGHFYTYRVRAKNKAGLWSAWSKESEAAVTGLPAEVISNVSNYPNPFDTRKGGEEGKTHITYILNQDCDVTITLYDLLGYKVMEMVFGKGQPGGKQGPNDAPWEGKNELGDLVARGGYIAHIKAVGATGTKIQIRKIGVIH
ncbi:MAG: hypothetical protein Q7K21_05040, partial [Elusimicrobiota bacterium]|nr:hypothetical protein [Elusimicrobiota bacterium]